MQTALEKMTAEKLAEMWTENTGVHMMDSGGDNGRQWQRNAGKTVADFLAEPEIYLDGEMVIRNSFHYCLRALDFTADSRALTEQFRAWIDTMPSGYDGYHYNGYNDVLEFITKQLGASPIEELDEIEIFNTYNDDDILDSVLMVGYFEHNGVDYVALSKHGGADVRGGYSDFVFFELGCEPLEFALDRISFCGYCKACDEWETYESYSDLTCRICEAEITEVNTW